MIQSLFLTSSFCHENALFVSSWICIFIPVSDEGLFGGESRTFVVDGRTYVAGWNKAVTRPQAQKGCVMHGGTLAELYDQQKLSKVV